MYWGREVHGRLGRRVHQNAGTRCCCRWEGAWGEERNGAHGRRDAMGGAHGGVWEQCALGGGHAARDSHGMRSYGRMGTWASYGAGIHCQAPLRTSSHPLPSLQTVKDLEVRGYAHVLPLAKDAGTCAVVASHLPAIGCAHSSFRCGRCTPHGPQFSQPRAPLVLSSVGHTLPMRERALHSLLSRGRAP